MNYLKIVLYYLAGLVTYFLLNLVSYFIAKFNIDIGAYLHFYFFSGYLSFFLLGTLLFRGRQMLWSGLILSAVISLTTLLSYEVSVIESSVILDMLAPFLAFVVFSFGYLVNYKFFLISLLVIGGIMFGVVGGQKKQTISKEVCLFMSGDLSRLASLSKDKGLDFERKDGCISYDNISKKDKKIIEQIQSKILLDRPPPNRSGSWGGKTLEKLTMLKQNGVNAWTTRYDGVTFIVWSESDAKLAEKLLEISKEEEGLEKGGP